MSPEERQLLQGLFERIQNAGGAPRDQDAEAFIANAVKALPYAPYLLAQTVIVQDQALRAANDRLQQLEAQVRELQQRAQQQQAGAGSGGFLGGLGSLFGGAAPPPPPPPRAPSPGWNQTPQQGGWQQPTQQNYAPQPGPWRAPARRTNGRTRWRLRWRPLRRPPRRAAASCGRAWRGGWRRRRRASRQFDQGPLRRRQ